MKGLAMIIMDALDINLIRNLDMGYAQNLYRDSGDILTCSTFPHTQTSNIRIWSGEHRNWFWVWNMSYRWIDPARNMDRDNDFKGAFHKNDDIKVITYDHLKDDGIDFIWDWCEREKLNARALQLPITLPPYSYNAPEETPYWFPYEAEDIEKNREDKHRLTMKGLEEIADGDLDFYCTSFASPDKALHSPAEGHAPDDFPEKEIPKLDKVIKDIDQFCNENDIGYCIFGDHGAPGGNSGPQFGTFYNQKIKAVRHTKHSVILGNIDSKPIFTHQMYSWMKDVLSNTKD